MRYMPSATPSQEQTAEAMSEAEGRRAPRFTLLIRTAKLHVSGHQYLCLLRDVSATGASIRTFHPLAEDAAFAIEFDTGDIVTADLVWQKDKAAGFHFHTQVDVDAVMLGAPSHRKRDLRFDIEHPIKIHTRDSTFTAQMCNLSRQGGRIYSEVALALDQPLRITGFGLADIEARVRWRAEGSYGLVFDTTFALEQLAAVLGRFPGRQDRLKLS